MELLSGLPAAFSWVGAGVEIVVEGMVSGLGCHEAGLGGVAGLGGNVVAPPSGHTSDHGQACLWVFSLSLGAQNE